MDTENLSRYEQMDALAHLNNDYCDECRRNLDNCECNEDIGGNVEPDRIEANMAFSEWLDSRGDALAQPESFSQWLNQTGDAICE